MWKNIAKSFIIISIIFGVIGISITTELTAARQNEQHTIAGDAEIARFSAEIVLLRLQIRHDLVFCARWCRKDCCECFFTIDNYVNTMTCCAQDKETKEEPYECSFQP